MNNTAVKQFVLIGIILVLAYVLGAQMFAFFPGLLGAVTLYILMREYFFKLTVIKHYNKSLIASLFILASIIVIVLPVAGIVQVILPKFAGIIDNQAAITETLKELSQKTKNLPPFMRINQQQVMQVMQKIAAEVPGVLGATANMLTNTVLAFFLLYFMLVDGRKMEMSIKKYLPLKDSNIDNMWTSTRTMVISNAIGIPVLAGCQAIVAIIGYAIFGIDEFVLWGILTGVASLVPVIGCMLVWGPLCIYLFATAHPAAAIGLAIYSFVITGGIDNVLRFTILKKLGDVHPIITTLGIIVGLPMFGFMGLIFGPLLLSYLLLLIQIYRVEFPEREE
ncbi:MAG TPA: AI-2E family transporter [Flavipsychrobacter sp.]|nr:AI-2E family transporter [Chitinophagales bacterium]HLO71650.1 AI-2E family transporter [Flavipsychrobacter sp.]